MRKRLLSAIACVLVVLAVFSPVTGKVSQEDELIGLPVEHPLTTVYWMEDFEGYTPGDPLFPHGTAEVPPGGLPSGSIFPGLTKGLVCAYLEGEPSYWGPLLIGGPTTSAFLGGWVYKVTQNRLYFTLSDVMNGADMVTIVLDDDNNLYHWTGMEFILIPGITWSLNTWHELWVQYDEVSQTYSIWWDGLEYDVGSDMIPGGTNIDSFVIFVDNESDAYFDNCCHWNGDGSIDRIEVLPNPATVSVGDTQQFTATAFDQFNNIIPGVGLVWTTDVGSVNATGFFTAQSTPATGTVTAWNGTVSGSANVMIVEAIFNIDLGLGWNLISIPLEQYNESIDQVLMSIDGKWDCIQAYDAMNDTWLSNSTFKPDSLNTLKPLNHKMGFWINITEPNVTLRVGGSILSSTSINLFAGWNLVGYPSVTNETVANALWGTGADNVMVCDTSEPYHIKEVGPTYVMEPGEGYWVHVPADTNWIVERVPGNPQIMAKDIRFSNVEPENGELISIEGVIWNVGSVGAIVDVNFYDGVMSSENLIGTDIIFVPAQAEFISYIDWIATPGGVHMITIGALINETWATQTGYFDPFLIDNYCWGNLSVMPNFLLVDDDNQVNDQSPGDTVSFMRASFEATDFDYDFTIVSAGGNGPGYDYGDYPMADYDVVIWMTGYEIFSTLTLTDIGELEKFLDGGGSLWFISQGFWDEAGGDADLATFADTYLHTPTPTTALMPMLDPGLPDELYGNDTHPVTYEFADDPLTSTDRITGPEYERSYYWNEGDVPVGTLALNSSVNCYAYTYDSDEDPMNSVVDSRIYVQTWEFSRIEDTATQAQFTYKVLPWLGNITTFFKKDFAVSQQDIVPKTVSISEMVTISAVIRNNAFINFSVADDVYVLLYHNSLPEFTTYTQITFIEKMGGEYEINFNWVADTVGTHEFIWVVDPDNRITETNEFNNQISIYLNNITVEVLP